jgi:hypothetical protein
MTDKPMPTGANMTEGKIILGLHYIHALMPLIDLDGGYYNLRGIRIEPHKRGGCLLIATNGPAMGIIYDVKAFAPGNLTWEVNPQLIALASVYDERNDDGDCEEKPTHIELVSPLLGQIMEAVKGDEFADGWINWRSVVCPPDARGTSQALGWNVLKGFANVRKNLAIRSTNLDASDEDFAASVVSTELMPEFFGVVMPRRIPKKSDPVLPEWLVNQ